MDNICSVCLHNSFSVGFKFCGTFNHINGKIKSVKWTDNGEELQFKQDGDTAEIYTTGYPYGTNYVVRVAEAEIE